MMPRNFSLTWSVIDLWAIGARMAVFGFSATTTSYIYRGPGQIPPVRAIRRRIRPPPISRGTAPGRARDDVV